jgi:hypothetical protein
VVVTEAFVEQAKFVARAAGMPDVPRVVLPHPTAGTGAATIEEIARAIAPSVMAVLQKGTSQP